jgi:hypothetical protein
VKPLIENDVSIPIIAADDHASMPEEKARAWPE